MKLGPIVLKLRLANTSFGQQIGGAADMESLQESTFAQMAFVIPLGERAGENQQVNTVLQTLDEGFAVVVALANDTHQVDKLGLRAYDKLDDLRAEIFSAILGWEMDGYETPVSYVGGTLVDLNAVYLWYQFEFSAARLIQPCDGVQEEATDWLDTIYAQYILSPDENVPWAGALPVAAGVANGEQSIDLTDNPYDGPFEDRAFEDGFDRDEETEEQTQRDRRIYR